MEASGLVCVPSPVWSFPIVLDTYSGFGTPAMATSTSTVLLTKLLSVFGSNSSPNASNNSSSDPGTAGTARFNRTDPLIDTDPPAASDASVQTNAFTQLTPTSGEEANGNPEPSWLT